MDATTSPLADKPRKRTRRCTSKSRDGCSRCKTRQVKCDGNRPTCKNCERPGAHCLGYQQQLRWSTKYERPRRNSNRASPTHLVQQANLDSRPERNMTESNTEPTTVVASSFREEFGAPMVADDPWAPSVLSLELMSSTLDQDLAYDLAGSAVQSEFRDAAMLPRMAITPSPAHIPTTLIEYWFRHVCPLRSTFDSGINYNRQVARSTWTSSEAVSNVMQALAAACLANSMPQFREILPSLRSQALSAVRAGIARVQESTTPKVTVDLVFALLSLGTSLHWFMPISSSGAEVSWLESARSLLSLWKPRLAAADGLVHAYFTQALTCWEMLLAPLGHGPNAVEIRKERQQLRDQSESALNLNSAENEISHDKEQSTKDHLYTPGSRPNSWCGISSEVIYTFGQVLALCRSVSIRATDGSTSVVNRASDVLCDMSIARKLQKELLSMDFDFLILLEEAQGYSVQTQDEKTPVPHLLLTAEAFRIAALLQLYLTLEELPILPMVQNSDLFEHRADYMGQDSRKDLIRRMALGLAKLLDRIPVESGCKSIHPILYLAVAVGFCDTQTAGPQDQNQNMVSTHEFPNSRNTGSSGIYCLQPTQMSRSALGPDRPLQDDDLSDDLQTAVFRARDMILTRLDLLQRTLLHASSTFVTSCQDRLVNIR